MAKIIDGRAIATEIKDELKIKVELLKKYGVEPCLAVIKVGNNPASNTYVKNKQKACEYVGVKSILYSLSEETPEEELIQLIHELNATNKIHGILVQLPLPDHIFEESVINAISPEKDVDGFRKDSPFNPCTPAGIITLLKSLKIDIEGKNCVVVGRSDIVGKPVAEMLLDENGTVTICHSKTRNLGEITRKADILVVAVGKPKFIKSFDVKIGATVIDVGINRDEEGKLCGDVFFDSVKHIASYVTPVPGGVGPMTVVMLIENVILAAAANGLSDKDYVDYITEVIVGKD